MDTRVVSRQLSLGKLVAACLLGAVATLTHAQSGPAAGAIAISSGLVGGGYWNMAARLQGVASGDGLTIENRASVGSLDNLKALLDKSSPVSLAFVQADALQYYLKENPAVAQSIETLKDAGQECVFIISSRDSDIETDKDMQASPRLHLGMKSSKSGIWVTFNTMKELVPELKKTTLIYGDTVQMMSDIAHPKSNIDEAVMVVHGTNEHSPEIDMVIASPDKFQFVEITDERFSRTAPGTGATYQRQRVTPGAVAGASAVETLCVQGLLVANTSKLTADQRGKLAALIDSHWARVRPQNS